MTKEKGRKHEKRLADMTITPPADAPAWSPYRDGTQDESYTVDLLGGGRIFHGLWCVGGQIVDFVLIHQVEVGAEWVDIVQVDCCHNEVHVHRSETEGDEARRVLRKIESPEDLLDGMAVAGKLIYDEWENNLRRWEHGR